MSDLATAWRVHNEINLFLIERLPEAAFQAVTLLKTGKPSTGRTVSRVLAHMHAVRVSHLGREFLPGVPRFEDGATPERAHLLAAFHASGSAMEKRFDSLTASGALVRGRPAAVLLGYLIAHESHHRGQIVLALKQSGIRAPDEVRFGIWEHWFRPKLTIGRVDDATSQ